MGITAHWITRETLERQSRSLACRRMPGTFSFDKIAELLEEVYREYGISNKLIATVTDNASNLKLNAIDNDFEDDLLEFNEINDDYKQNNITQAHQMCQPHFVLNCN
ncbi:uncharacterized protein LOC135931873 [Gordionus sp. m RMFG-2023]|uniref:uncharacterized protein LOC135931873 n=1 Tax=Gordionus sp. m RMFG-2023 TaxID=3053472 RepID=UPI0031FD7977